MWARTAAGRGALVVPPQYAKRLFLSSSVTAVSVCSAATNELYDSTILTSLVLACSLNYWRMPVFGLRRNMDMAAAGGGLLYQMLFSAPQADEPARSLYSLSVAACCGCYGASRYFSFVARNYNASSAWHVALHMTGNLGNLMLFDGIAAKRRAQQQQLTSVSL